MTYHIAQFKLVKYKVVLSILLFLENTTIYNQCFGLNVNVFLR